MPVLHAPLSRLQPLGELRLDGKVGVGEVTLDTAFSILPGSWRALYLDEEAYDTLVDEGLLPDPQDESTPHPLLLTRIDREPPTAKELESLREVARVSIDGARFTLADLSLAAALEGDGFWDHLDGVHGVFGDGRGITLMLGGDGEAVVWAEAGPTPAVIFVELF